MNDQSIPAASFETKLVDLEGLKIEVLADKQDAAWYQQRKTFEEKASLLYRFIRDEGFSQFVDVGANVGPEDRDDTHFSINPSSSLDNRVNMPGWEQVPVPMVSLNRVLQKHGVPGKTFIKIDTQGFEFGVLRGAESWLRSHRDWVIKMEFAPHWLCSQGTGPLALLTYLQDDCGFEIAEFAERISFGTPNLDALFAYIVRQKDREAFLQYVTSLNTGGRGWVDLLVRPKQKKRWLFGAQP